MEDWGFLTHYYNKMIENSTFKAVVSVIIWGLTLIFGEYRPMYGVILSLYLSDFVLGYYRAWIDPETKPSSRRMRAGLLKLMCYMFLLFVGYQLSKTEISLLILLQTTAETTIALTESKSVLENLRDIAAVKGTSFPVVDVILNVIEGKIKEQK